MFDPKLILDCKNRHGEGIIWCEKKQLILWTDIEGKRLWMFSPETEETESYEMPDRLCAFMIWREDTILAAFDSYLATFSLGDMRIYKFFDFEPDNPFSRLNDGKQDPYGNFIVGGMIESESSDTKTSVIKIDNNLRVHTLMNGITCANSICFSNDGTIMYFSDTPEKTILAYSYSPDCISLKDATEVYKGEGRFSYPDGSAVDSEGYIWNAVWNGYAVIRIHPETGIVDKIVELPVKNPTCVVIGGDEMNTLYITTSQYQMTAEEISKAPFSGGLYSVDLSCCDRWG